MAGIGRDDDLLVRDERWARLALACVSEPGDKRLADVVTAEGALAAWQSLWGPRSDTAWARRLAGVRLRNMVLCMQQRQLRYVIPGDVEWPDCLDDLAEAELNRMRARPLGLWVAGPGHLAEWAQDSLAIVGTRTSTPYGEMVTAELAAGLARGGTTVVSGGAYGIDVCAHRGALAVNGRTIAVLASGLDVVYPRGNAAVFHEIRTQGLLVSELPPGQRPSRPRFLSRNRVIAGLAPAALMVEAKIRSGAQNTLSWSEELSRIRMAVPGPVTSAQSEGPHDQIRRAAQLVTSVAEIRELLAPLGAETLAPARGPQRMLDGLGEELAEVFEQVPGSGGDPAEVIAVRCGRHLLDTLAALGELEEKGLVVRGADGSWRMKSGAVG